METKSLDHYKILDCGMISTLDNVDNIEKFNDQIKTVLENDGEYRIIESVTDAIIKQG